MSILTIQLDLRLRQLTPDGLDDVTGTFTHYDLPMDAAGHEWSDEQRDALATRIAAQFGDVIALTLVGLLDHCRYEQPELPFG